MVLKVVAVVLATLAPLLALGWQFYDEGPGPNPVERLEHVTGIWALRLLLLTLLVRPLWRSLRLRGGFVWLRRTLGLVAFFYATVHLAVYFVFDLGLAWWALGADVLQRPFIAVGMGAWLLLLPLAVTSTAGWQRRLGRHWVRLHRLVYVATLLGGVHFLWLVKKDIGEPLLYLALFAGLMIWRSVFLNDLKRFMR